MSRWASLAATGTFADGGKGTRLQRIVVNSPTSLGASLTVTDSTGAGSTLSVAFIDCKTAFAFDYGNVLLANGLFVNLAGGTSGLPLVTIVYD